MADQILLATLKAGPEEWNTWRAAHPDQPLANLTGAGLNNFDFRGYELHHVDFSGAQLQKANLTDVLLGASKLDEADLTDAILDGVIFASSTLRRAILRGVKCSKHSHMSSADFTEADLTNAQIDNAGLFGSDFTGANLTDAVFKECGLNCCRFVGTNLTNTELSSNMSESTFSGAVLVNTHFKGLLYRASFQDADLSHINPNNDFSNSWLTDVNLTNANLTGCKFDNASLSGGFTGAILQNCSFKSAQLTAHGLAKAMLTGADFTGAQFTEGLDLTGINFSNANLSKAVLSKVILTQAKFTGANLTDCQFRGAQLNQATFRNVIGVGANFKGANMTEANISGTDFSEIQLRDTDLTKVHFYDTTLEYAMMVNATVTDAHFERVWIYGLANWDMIGKPGRQHGMIITQQSERMITVDNIQLAQIIYTLLRRENFTPLIDTLTSKAVLILGRFSPERKAILDAIAAELSQHDLLPILFDFTEPESRATEETIRVLAGLSKFVIADITAPKSAPLEMHAIAPDLQIPIFPLIEKGEMPFSMLASLRRPWVETIDVYTSEANAVSKVSNIISRANNLIEQIRQERLAFSEELRKKMEDPI